MLDEANLKILDAKMPAARPNKPSNISRTGLATGK